MDSTVIITANGSGERMKSITDGHKCSLYYGEKRILEHLLETFPAAKVLTSYNLPYIEPYKIIKCEPSNSRKETLENLRGMKNVLIVDCDIFVNSYVQIESARDVLYKKANINAGLYKIIDMDTTLSKMQDDEIIFEHPVIMHADTIHLGTTDEYYKAIL